MKKPNIHTQFLKFYFLTGFFLIIYLFYTSLIYLTSNTSFKILILGLLWLCCINQCLKMFEEIRNKLEDDQLTILNGFRQELRIYLVIFLIIIVISIIRLAAGLDQQKEAAIVILSSLFGMYGLSKVCLTLYRQE